MKYCSKTVVCNNFTPVQEINFSKLFPLFTEYGVTSLELLELRVPAHVPLGTRAQLSCRWALGPADVLYSVKWYKDGREFFRHVPRDLEPRRKFPLPGVDVEVVTYCIKQYTYVPLVGTKNSWRQRMFRERMARARP